MNYDIPGIRLRGKTRLLVTYFVPLFVSVGLSLWLVQGVLQAATGGPDASGYVFLDSAESGGPTFNFEDISGSGTLLPLADEEVSSAIPIGFSFNYYGIDYTDIYVSSNGFLTVLAGQPAGCCSGEPLPQNSSVNGVIAGWWDDLDPTQGSGTIHYQTLGTAPNRYLIVQFTNVEHDTPSGTGGLPVTMQFKLFEGSNVIEVHYQTAPNDGSNHSAGIENPAGTVGLQYYYGTGSLASNSVVRYGILPLLNITKTANASILDPGDPITYTVTFSNSGSVTATNVVITDIIPISVTNTSVLSSGVAITDTGTSPAYVWQVEDLAPNQGGVITITGTLADPLAPGIFSNTATISASNLAASPSDTVTTTVAGPSLFDPYLSKLSSTGGTVLPGEIITYTITVSNPNAVDLTNVTISDTLPISTTYVSGSIAGGDSRNFNDPLLSWTINTLQPGPANLITLTFAARVDTGLATGTDIINTAAVTSTEIPTITTSTVTDTVAGGGTLAVVSSFEAYESDDQVILQWETVSEVGTVGFYLYRLESSGQEYQLNSNLLPALYDAPQGGLYRFVDPMAQPGQAYTYRLIEVEVDGTQISYGPFPVTPQPGGGPAMVEEYSREPHPLSSPPATFQVASSEPVIESAAGPVDLAKIAVKEDGMYRLSVADLSAVLGRSEADVLVLMANGGLELTNLGQPVSLLPATDSSGVYFYGQEPASPYSAENIYWLAVLSSSVSPKPDEFTYSLYLPFIQKQSHEDTRRENLADIPLANQNQTFTEDLLVEENLLPLTALFHEPEADFWKWETIYAGSPPRNYTFQLDGLAGVGPAHLIVRLHGGSSTTANPDHHAIISLNGVQVGEAHWDGLTPTELSLPLDPALLRAGENNLEIRALLDTGALYSVIVLDSFQISYQRLYQAVDNRLLAPAAAHSWLTIAGFTEPDILVYEISNPTAPQPVTALTIEGEAGNYLVSFATVKDGLYLALTPAAIEWPLWLRPESPSTWQQPTHEADYLIIAPSAFQEAAHKLADYRQSQGLATLVVNVEDIYDEFNFGLASPQAIQAMLRYAGQQWQQSPSYVLLAGNGTFDYKNYLGYRDNWVPPLLVDTPYGLYSSDTKFGDLTGSDDVPELAVGRLPATSAIQLEGMIDKIRRYEQGGGEWVRQITLLADSPANAGNFPADSDRLADLIPAEYEVDKIHLSTTIPSEARQQLLARLDSGTGLLNYIGHAGLDRLSRHGLLRSSDVANLTNETRLPVVTAMTCVVGRFGLAGTDSLGELLVQHNGGGAIAVLGPSSISLNSEANLLDQAFYRTLFVTPGLTLGEYILQAQADYSRQGGSPYLLTTYNLLGDPALQLPW